MRILLLVVFIGLVSGLKAQWNITVTPSKIEGFTGSVRNLDGYYEKFDGAIRLGKGSFYSFFRGYAIFDISSVPDKAIVKSIRLIINTKHIPERLSVPVEITKLPVNPRQASLEDLYNSINSGILLGPSGDYLKTKSENVIQLNSVANDDLTSHLEQNWWAVGFRQVEDGLGGSRTVGAFEGYDFTDSIAPLCVVTYELPYKRKFYEGRKVTYIEELTFKNSEITIEYWDHLKIDGDIISLYLNGTPVVSKYLLKRERELTEVKLKTDMPNDLFLYAHNEGMNPPNTVAIRISDGITDQNFILESDLNSCEAVLIKVGR
ncbi:MAG: hypothetical protein JSV22_04200 [Bacteroidales bacterium]|nr:MAG: hypothetical protein JSV22_04200 [Bacteroidales bacterium]